MDRSSPSPEGTTFLNRFSFWWTFEGGSGSMAVRGEVYAWDGSKATGAALWQSRRRTISFTDSLFHKVPFRPNGISVTPGAQYVIFASIDKDFERCTGDYKLSWGSVDGSIYGGGTFAFQNNGGDESQWTATPWSTVPIDLAMKVGGS